MFRSFGFALLLLVPWQGGGIREATYYGPANQSCGSWTSEHEQKSPGSFLMDGWMLGFVSATELMDWRRELEPSQRMRVTDAPGILAWVARHCSEAPTDSLQLTVLKLVAHLRERTDSSVTLGHR
jgi:hypothetical protein